MERFRYFQSVLFFFTFLFCTFLGMQTTFASALQVIAPDTIAGYGNDIEIRNADKNSTISVFIQDTTSQVQKKNIQTNSQGTAALSLSIDETIHTGTYNVVAVRQGLGFDDGPIISFEVYPDTTAPLVSQVKSETISLAVGKTAKISVILKDQYGNVILGHRVSLISSRGTDTIIPQGNGQSDENGKVEFFISSDSQGSSSFTAQDITDNITIQKRKNILFYNSTASKNIGASDFTADIFSAAQASSDSGEVASFEILFPDTVKADSDENYLTVRALDSAQRIVKDFTGTIVVRIPTDSNAEVPGENGKYVFEIKDQGEFTFPRAVVFSEIGDHRLEVFLYDRDSQEINVNIHGKTEVVVVENTDNPDKENPNADKIKILFPTDNSEFSSSIISVRGKALPDTDVKIFLDDIPLTTTAVNGNGVFTTSLDSLEDGEHTIYAMQVEGKREVSPEVNFTTDSVPPNFLEATFSPHSVPTKGLVTLTLSAEKNLKTIEAFWGDDSQFLTEQEDGIYQLTFSAPENPGRYEIEILLTDRLANTTKEKIRPLLEVTDPQEISPLTLTGNFNSDTQEIDLTWKLDSSISSQSVPPILYIIQMGETENTLKKRKSVAGNNRETSLSALKDGEKYFFSVIPVGQNGEEQSSSNIIELDIPKISTPVTTQAPEITPVPTPIAIETWDFSLTGGQNSLNLQWDERKGTSKYLIFYGISSGDYAEKKEASGNILSKSLSDMIPGVRYYVRLQAIDALGNISHDYGEKIAIAGENNLHPAPTTAPRPYPQWMSDTGPKFFFLLGSLFLAFGGFIMGKRSIDSK